MSGPSIMSQVLSAPLPRCLTIMGAHLSLFLYLSLTISFLNVLSLLSNPRTVIHLFVYRAVYTPLYTGVYTPVYTPINPGVIKIKTLAVVILVIYCYFTSACSKRSFSKDPTDMPQRLVTTDGLGFQSVGLFELTQGFLLRSL